MNIIVGIYLIGAFVTAAAVPVARTANDDTVTWRGIVFGGLLWPVWWVSLVIYQIQGMAPAKCAWCGKTVAPLNRKPETMEKWRAHYLDECQEHPLAAKARHLKEVLDEDTALIQNLKDELEPYRAIKKKMRVNAIAHIHGMTLRGVLGREDER